VGFSGVVMGLSFVCTILVLADDSWSHRIRLGYQKVCGVRTDAILRCFDNVEALN
jgi:hypothetical protein